MRAHSAIFYTIYGSLPLRFCSQAPSIVAVHHFENSCDYQSAQPEWLTHLAIRSDEGTKSQERAHLVNAGKFNPWYLICQILAILYANRSNWQELQLLDWAHLVIFTDRSDWCIKSSSVSPPLDQVMYSWGSLNCRGHSCSYNSLLNNRWQCSIPPFFLVIVVHSINNIFFSVLNNFPHCSTNHVSSGIRSNCQAMALSFDKQIYNQWNNERSGCKEPRNPSPRLGKPLIRSHS